MPIFHKPIYPSRDVGYSPVYKNPYKQNSRVVVGQKFGENMNTFYAEAGLKGHQGIDIPCVEGTPVFASHDGLVTKLSLKPTNGLGITIQSDDGSYKTIYWHLKEILVTLGQKIACHDLIGLADSTGQSTGNHLHFGYYPITADPNNGYGGAEDPLPFVVEPKFTFNSNLFLGLKNDDVKNLQIALANEGFLGQVGFYGFTGFFGTQTLDAVKRFQKKYGILSTGFVGKLTRAKLNELYN